MAHWITHIEKELLHFWFGRVDSATGLDPKKQKMWFTKTPQTDQEIDAKFGTHLDRAAREGTPKGIDSPRTRLAMIILLDQFSRNIHRGRPRSFGTDDLALALCLEGMAKGLDLKLNPAQRVFFYLPMEHAEDLGIQDQSVKAFQTLCDEVTSHDRKVFDSFLEYAEKHRAVILRFGRFPHRNDILGRQSTDEEIAYLKQPGSGF